MFLNAKVLQGITAVLYSKTVGIRRNFSRKIHASYADLVLQTC